MVSLTKKQTVGSLHSRFRALHQPPEQSTSGGSQQVLQHSTSPSLDNGKLTLAQRDTSFSTQANQVVRFVPPEVRETRSQQDRLARADAGDLQARLELISLESAEAALAQRRCKHQPEWSILSYLRDPSDGLARYQAASSILEQLADKTEETAFDSVLVFRYIKAYELWKDHPSSEIRSAKDLVKQLDSSDYVQANIVLGTSAQAAKRNYLRIIESFWGAGWFEEIPTTIRDPLWNRAEECSKRTLVQIAANAKQGVSLDEAVKSWTAAIEKRNDPATRREQRSKSRVTPYIMPNDVALLNQVAGDAHKGRRTCDIFLPEDVKEDRLRVDVVPLLSPSKSAPSKPDYSFGCRPCKPQKRKNTRIDREVSRVEDDTDAEDEDGWTRVGERSMVKRVRSHLIRKPVNESVDLDSEADRNNASTQLGSGNYVERQAASSPSQPPSAQPTSTQYQSRMPKTDRPLLTCDGPAVALMFRKFVDLFDEMPSLDNDACAESRCCDNCRPLVKEKSAHLQRELVQWAADLERVQIHTSRDHEVSPSQDHGVSPTKPQSVPVQSPLTILDSDSDRV